MDFLVFYVAAYVFLMGGNPYDMTTLSETGGIIVGPQFQALNGFHYPPWTLYFFSPFCLLQPDSALKVFRLLNMAGVATGICLVARCSTQSLPRVLGIVLLCLTTVPISEMVIFGSLGGLLTLGLALTASYAQHHRKSWLCIGMLLLSLKPHLWIISLLFMGGSGVIRHRQRFVLLVPLLLIALSVVDRSLSAAWFQALHQNSSVLLHTNGVHLASILPQLDFLNFSLMVILLSCCIAAYCVWTLPLINLGTHRHLVLAVLSMSLAPRAWIHDIVPLTLCLAALLASADNTQKFIRRSQCLLLASALGWIAADYGYFNELDNNLFFLPWLYALCLLPMKR